MGEEVVVIRPGLILLLNGLFRQRGVFNGLFCHNSAYTICHGGVEIYRQKILFLPEHIVRTPAHNDAVICLGHFPNYIELGKGQLLIQGKIFTGGSTGHIKTIDEAAARLFIIVLHLSLIHI